MILDEAVEEIAKLVWQEGHYSTPWDEWPNKERWRNVARSILDVADRIRS